MITYEDNLDLIISTVDCAIRQQIKGGIDKVAGRIFPRSEVTFNYGNNKKVHATIKLTQSMAVHIFHDEFKGIIVLYSKENHMSFTDVDEQLIFGCNSTLAGHKVLDLVDKHFAHVKPKSL